jgi:hypothetical protein
MRITLELNLSTSGNGIICVAILAIIVVVGIVAFFCETSATLYCVFSPFRTIVGALNTDIESLLYSNYRGTLDRLSSIEFEHKAPTTNVRIPHILTIEMTSSRPVTPASPRVFKVKAAQPGVPLFGCSKYHHQLLQFISLVSIYLPYT